jgi:hypothetical protein
MACQSHKEQLAPKRAGPKSGPAREKTLQRSYGQKLRGRLGKIAAAARPAR